jgi:hypothetical protein
MKSEIYSAYIAGLCPLELLMRHGPDSYRKHESDTGGDEPPADGRMSSRRKRALLFVLILGFAMGAWQLLSHSDETQAAADPIQGSVSGRSVLLFVLILGFTIGAGELLSRTSETRPTPAAARTSAVVESVLGA